MTAPALSAQDLYQLEKAKRVSKNAPAMAAAAAELQRQDDARREDRKGGRPRGPALNLGKNRLRFDTSDAPGRAEFLALDRPFHPEPPRASGAPSLQQPPQAGTTMPSGIATNGYEKTCARSGRDFIGKGARSKYCGECDECVAVGGESAPPRTKKAARKSAKAKKEKPEKKRPRVETGFRRQAAAVKGKGAYGETIASMLAEADVLEQRRTRLLAAVEHLELLDRSA